VTNRLRTRTLGRTGLSVSELGFGAWGIGGGAWGRADEKTATAALKKALQLGVTFFDSALAYGDGRSERLIAHAVKQFGVRRQVTIATKIPPKNLEWPAGHGTPIREAFPKDWIIKCTEQSLQNLESDFIDLQQIHVWSPRWMKETEWIETLRDLQLAGKIRYLGVSINDHEPDAALDLVRSGWVDTIQVIFNLFDQSPTLRLLPLAQEHRIGIIARCPFDEGGLTGTLQADTTFGRNDWRREYFRGDRLAETVRRANALTAAVGDGYETLAHAALQYVLSHKILSEPSVSTVIPGMRRTAHVEANARYAMGPAFSPELFEHVRDHAWARNFYD
jgi:aryl-alcohol dehydrogenase-like predicted oxidoreductase